MLMEPESPSNVFKFLRGIIEEQVPLNKLLGFRLESLNAEGACLKIEMTDLLIGNYIQGILHGGVISTFLDVTGTVTAWTAILKSMPNLNREEIAEAISRIGTIDLRVDFLRPGRGVHFKSVGAVMRAGKRVAVVRMELYNDKETLIAVGTGTYTVS